MRGVGLLFCVLKFARYLGSYYHATHLDVFGDIRRSRILGNPGLDYEKSWLYSWFSGTAWARLRLAGTAQAGISVSSAYGR